MSKFQSKIIKDFEAQGYCVIKLSKTNKNGIADLLVAKDGCRTKLIEVKEKTDTIKPLQIFQNIQICKIAGFDFDIMQDGKDSENITEVFKSQLSNLF